MRRDNVRMWWVWGRDRVFHHFAVPALRPHTIPTDHGGWRSLGRRNPLWMREIGDGEREPHPAEIAFPFLA